MLFSRFLYLAFLTATTVAHFVVPNDDQNMSGIVVNGISSSVREKYMRLVGLSFSFHIPMPFKLMLIRPTKLSSSKVDLVLSLLMVPSS